ncbi:MULTISPECIES: L-lactate MFS transporter [Hymenobacter]|uniref:OFA family MFS transporter n=2 Tax=Hymenobacter TaxID=89966 RepID=A0ABS6X453_9BACT|nr:MULTISPECIES: OFA family MFS transporter [Hymenobacter]MBO3271176.1 OFA family MFS transporter [Hymenobacter defluvii]MBW3130611.1 OFA family MFS transporter [Hymenobacter profundi]QNE41447.1 OFA family MFS transporter [Hymenobacter sp. NBH84]
MAETSLLDRSRTIAGPGYNRWLIPPAALAIHLAIGQAYAFSVFNKPLGSLISGDPANPAPDDWTPGQIGWTFSIAIVLLGLSAAVFGKWLERVGPRKAMMAASLCFGGGFLIGSLGVHLHSLALLYLGYGVVGGIGLGIGYISPVSTLIKWFPDRKGVATGMAIMGFGGGAMIGSPLAVALMDHFKGSAPQGVAPTFIVMGIIYLLFMQFGVWTIRVPADDWAPEGYVPSTEHDAMITTANVSADNAIKTPQFWLLWVVLLTNVTAGIGVLETASPLIQNTFSDAAMGAGRGVTAAAAAGFVGLLSLFNLLGRFFWSSASDKLGRKTTYAIYFILGIILYAFIPTLGAGLQLTLYVVAACIIISMYGGGFATAPAYLSDLFGKYQVGAIHGRLLTAWSTAGVLGPLIVHTLSEHAKEQNLAGAAAYQNVFYTMAGVLVVGLLANLAVRPVKEQYHEKGPVTIEAGGH